MEIVISLLVMFLVSYCVVRIWMRIFTEGTLRVDRSNPQKDVYRLEIDDLEAISRRSRIIIKIDNKADLSQK